MGRRMEPERRKASQVPFVDRLYEVQELGTKVSRQFKRYGIPFPPYVLRHAYGIRASVTFELPVTAAALMGHHQATWANSGAILVIRSMIADPISP